MNWTNELVMQFLELLKQHPCIWNTSHVYHKNRIKVNDAWIDIIKNLEYTGTLKELKKKRDSLMAAYRAYRIKINKSEKSGASDVYQPSWYAFEIMDSFLSNVYKCKESTFSEDEQNESQGTEEIFDETSNPSVDQVDEKPSTSQEIPIRVLKRKINYDPLEIRYTRKETDETLNHPETVSHWQVDEDDECNIFGKLVAKKLRRFSEDSRDLLMIKINELIYSESQNRRSKNVSFSVN